MSIQQALTDATQALNTNAQAYFNKQGEIAAAIADMNARADFKIAEMNAFRDSIAIVGNHTLTVNPTVEADIGTLTFATLQAAIDWVWSRDIRGKVTIQLSDGVHNIGDKTYIGRNPTGWNLEIVGNRYNPDACILETIAPVGGISHGLVFGQIVGVSIAGVKIRSTNPADNKQGLLAQEGSFVILEEGSVKIENCHVAITTWRNGAIAARKLTVVGCNSGALCDQGFIDVAGSDMTGRGRDYGNWWSHRGMLARNGGSIAAAGSEVKAYKQGVSAGAGGSWYGQNCLVEDCTEGYVCENGGYVWMEYTPSVSEYVPVVREPLAKNCERGFVATSNGMIAAYGARADSCTLGFDGNTGGYLYADSSGAKDCVTGFNASTNGLIWAYGSIANCSGNTTNHALADAVPGNIGGMVLYN